MDQKEDCADLVRRFLSGDAQAEEEIFADAKGFLNKGLIPTLLKNFQDSTQRCLLLLNRLLEDNKEKLVAEGVTDVLVRYIGTCRGSVNRPYACSCLHKISDSVWTRDSIRKSIRANIPPDQQLLWVNSVQLNPHNAEELDDWTEMLLNTDLISSQKPEPPSKHIYDLKDFPFLKILEENFDIIKQEALNLANHQEKLIPWPEKFIAPTGQWDILGLYAFENRLDKLCWVCPETTKLLETIPGLQTALFSCLRPRAHIKPHIGYYQYSEKILRVHLGLIVPEGCVLRVNSQNHGWEEGKLIIFDDTFRHEAWNPSYDTTRVVLMFDIDVSAYPEVVKEEYRNPEFIAKSKKQRELGEQALISGDLLSAISQLVDKPENVAERPEQYL